jgi:transcriptional regulator with XRE-family HTH domain
MSESIDTIRTQLWEKMRDKPYRDTFVAAHLSTNIAAQIQTIREQRGWTKKKLAEKAGMAPSRITVMEDPSYENFSLTTLKRLASAFDVALIARFAPFSDLVDWVAELSPEKLEASTFEDDSLSYLDQPPIDLAKRHADNPQSHAGGINFASTDVLWKPPTQGLPALGVEIFQGLPQENRT